jgi:hypothetical protein
MSPPTFTDPTLIWRVTRRGVKEVAVTSMSLVCRV